MAAKTRGGQRPGAGRKPSDHKKQSITIRLSPDAMAALDSVSNKSRFIDTAIIEHAARQTA